MKSVLIVEDHPVVAEATQALLARSAQLLRFTVCHDAAAAVDQLDGNGADWFRILLDLDVPGAYGLSLTQQVRQRGLQARCCIVTGLQNPEFVAALEAQGFLGYIVKAAPMPEFAADIQKVLAGERVFPLPVSGGDPAGSVRLTRRQAELLDCVRRGMLSKQIAADLSLSEGTVNNHINATLKTLNVSTRTQAVARAIELGLIALNDSATALSPAR